MAKIAMVRHCIAFGCNNRSDKPHCKHLSWHSLPLNNKKLLGTWLVKIKWENMPGIAAEKREAKADKEEADKYHKLNQELHLMLTFNSALRSMVTKNQVIQDVIYNVTGTPSSCLEKEQLKSINESVMWRRCGFMESCQLEVKLFQLYHNEQSINHLTNELKAKSRDLDKLDQRKNEIDQQLKSKKQDSAKLSREMASVEKKITSKEAELNKNRPQYIKAKEKTSHVLKRLESSKKAFDKAKNVHKKHEAEIRELEHDLEEVRNAAAKYEEDVSGASQDENVELMDSQVEQYHAFKEQAGRETAALKLQLDKIVREQNSEQESLDQLKQKKVDLLAQQKHKTDQKTQLTERIEKLDEYISTNIQTVDKLRQDHDKMEKEINDANSRHGEISQLLEEVQGELNEAKMDKHESARHQKKQELLESMKRLFPGVYGRLIDLCEPVHKKYTLAITRVLGRNMDAIVVDTEKTGKDCIQYLREQHLNSLPVSQRSENGCTNIQTVDKLRQDHDKMEKEINDANSRHGEISQLLEEVQGELNEAKMDKHESARHQKKQELLESMKRLFPGVYGRLIDLCEPVHKKYTLAITRVLGRNMDAIVVDTEKTGKDCIQYLREQRADPEMFLPLDSIQVKPINEKLRQIGGTAKLVIDVIRYNPPVVKKALQFACANALVCDGMEEARKLAFGGAERKKTVSLDGTLFQKSGVISGGVSDLKAKARRWDEKQVEGMKKKRDNYLTELKDLSKHRRKEPELQNLRSQIDGLEHRLKYSTKDKETTEKQTLGEISKELKIIKKELDSLEPKREKLLLSMAKRSEEITNTEKRMNRVEDQVFRGFCEQINVENIRQYEEKQLKARLERDQRRLEFNNQESRLMNQLEYEKGRDTKGMEVWKSVFLIVA
ncbi:Structural maintenance of chromosomes protein 1A [Stylophora pistillata]|uniref:Structural maintenance of chromosomes protein 1A n=1 Tax=Stylophora pistillata TaxID=50429 RepID=A0A2B4SFB1_STYPI|nr:Structural maintenance of chromosomes protein 1A [Stylophora pistillata]